MAWPWDNEQEAVDALRESSAPAAATGGAGDWMTALPMLLGAGASIASPNMANAGNAVMQMGDYFRRQRMEDLSQQRFQMTQEAQQRREQAQQQQNAAAYQAARALGYDLPAGIPATNMPAWISAAREQAQFYQQQQDRQQQQGFLQNAGAVQGGLTAEHPLMSQINAQIADLSSRASSPQQAMAIDRLMKNRDELAMRLGLAEPVLQTTTGGTYAEPGPWQEGLTKDRPETVGDTARSAEIRRLFRSGALDKMNPAERAAALEPFLPPIANIRVPGGPEAQASRAEAHEKTAKASLSESDTLLLRKIDRGEVNPDTLPMNVRVRLNLVDKPPFYPPPPSQTELALHAEGARPPRGYEGVTPTQSANALQRTFPLVGVPFGGGIYQKGPGGTGIVEHRAPERPEDFELAKTISGSQLAQIAANKLITLAEDPKVQAYQGPIASWWDVAQRSAPGAVLGNPPKEYTQFRIAFATLRNHVLRVSAGLAQTGTETVNVKETLPSLSSQPSVFRDEVRESLSYIKEGEGILRNLAMRNDEQGRKARAALKDIDSNPYDTNTSDVKIRKLP